MNASVRISILFLLFTISIHAQWVWQNPKPQGNLLNDIYFLDTLHAMACGEGGTIIKTTNGGVDWTVRSISSLNLNCICWVSESIAFVGCNEGMIMKTEDGGANWIEQYSGNGTDFNSIYFFDENHGCIVGDYQFIYTTSNGGTNWIKRTSGFMTLFELYGVSFADTLNGLAVGINGIVLRTTNGGVNWVRQTNNYTEDLRAIHCINKNIAIAIGDYGRIIRTTDGGSTWTAQTGVGYTDLYSVSFKDELNGMACGGSTILKTINGGITWFKPIPSISCTTRSVCYVTPTRAAVVGASGAIFTTTTGGSTWVNQLHGQTTWLNNVSFADALHGVASGGTLLLSTSDGGENWNVFQADTSISAVAYKSQGGIRRCWAVGSAGRIYRSDDIVNWEVLNSGTNNLLVALSFIDLNTGWAVGVSGTIIKTTNAGNSWITQNSGTTINPKGVSFTDQYNGTVVGDAGMILRTTNGGDNWFFQTYSGSQTRLEGVSFLDANKGLIVGWSGIILRTTNGGNEWIYQPIGENNTLTEVCYADSNTAYVISSMGGLLLKSTDGGITWHEQESSTSNPLYGISFSDGNNGTIVGAGGTILRFTNGGTPVELVSFTGNVNKGKIELSWSTATETNNYGFEIEKSAQNNYWKKLGFVNGFGTTTLPQYYSFTDKNIATGNFKYRLKQMDLDGSSNFSKEVEVNVDFNPGVFILEQNHPNPFNPVTLIEYSVASAGNVKIVVYDVLGKKTNDLLNEHKSAGSYVLTFDGSSLPSGVYFYRIETGSCTETKKMLLLR